jgi:hypothetical protein
MVKMNYWAFIGIIQLIILTYQDLRNNKLVDDRHNWFMMGLTISLYSHYPHPFWYILVLIFVPMILMVIFQKYKVIGAADTKTILWTFIGFGLINLWILVNYAIWLLAVFLLYFLLAFILKKVTNAQEQKALPAYPVFLIVFILVSWLLL